MNCRFGGTTEPVEEHEDSELRFLSTSDLKDFVIFTGLPPALKIQVYSSSLK